ncbi:MAG TPA: ATP-binding protein [Gammaproteobacteria bacterium]|nr:ATP-binding protein [Gammaproteobacteria bacterium]
MIQVLAGPRQVGKTTLALQAAEAAKLPTHYISADDPAARDYFWLQQQWQIARLNLSKSKSAILILDEVQKIPDWTTTIKQLWDEDTRHKRQLQVLLLGSAPLLIQKGISESLAGRFEIIPVRHWSYEEMQQAFGWGYQQFVYFGGYPGAAPLIADETRWKRYIIDSLIETTISRDILSLAPIHKPALLRNLFYLGCHYSSQILSYQKMTGQLQDAGNTTTLAHYLELLAGAGLLTGLSKYAGQTVRQRGSSPKFQVLNTALMSAQLTDTYDSARENPEKWGRLVESAIGAHLINRTVGTDISVFYWREKNQEVDFILQRGEQLIALEVKSGRQKTALSGIAAFGKAFKPEKTLLIGTQGIEVESFLKLNPQALFD